MFKSEAASWFRIYEMFQFNAFHMYGIIGSALFCGAIITFVLKKFNVSSVVDGEPIVIPSKESGWKRYLFGGVFFGFGWAISGACPGPMFTVLGAGFAHTCGHRFCNARYFLLWITPKKASALGCGRYPRSKYFS